MTACRDGLGLDRALAYWFGELPDAESEAFEEHQWTCPACTRRLGWLAALGPALDTALRRRGGLRIALTTATVARLEGEGVRMRHYRTAGNHEVACTVSLDDDLVVSWFEVAPADDEQVALVMHGPGGVVLARTDDLPIERQPDGRGQLILAEAGDAIRAMPTMVLQFRVLGVDAGGAERNLGDYTFRHTAIGG